LPTIKIEKMGKLIAILFMKEWNPSGSIHSRS